MSFPGIPGRGPLPGGNDMAGMSEQEQMIVKTVRSRHLQPHSDLCNSSDHEVIRCQPPWKVARSKQSSRAVWASRLGAPLVCSCQAYGARPGD